MIPAPQNLNMSAALDAAEEELVANMQRGEFRIIVDAPLARPLLARLRAAGWQGQAVRSAGNDRRLLLAWDPAENPIEPPAVVEAIGGRAALEAAETIALELPKGARRFAVAPPSAVPALLKMFEATGWRATEKEGVIEVFREMGEPKKEADKAAGNPAEPTKASGGAHCVVYGDGSVRLPDRIRRAVNVWTGGVSFVDKGNGIVEMMSDDTFTRLAGLHDDGPGAGPAIAEPREMTDGASDNGKALYPLWFDRSVNAVRAFFGGSFDNGCFASCMFNLCRWLRAAGAVVSWTEEEKAAGADARWSEEDPAEIGDMAHAVGVALAVARKAVIEHDRMQNTKTLRGAVVDAMEALRAALPPETNPEAPADVMALPALDGRTGAR